MKQYEWILNPTICNTNPTIYNNLNGPLRQNEIYGFRHLPSVIRYLRKRNIKINSEPKYGDNRFGGKVYWVDYVLAPPKEQTPKVNEQINKLKNMYKVA